MSNTSENHGRIEYIDATRGFGVLLVIIGHIANGYPKQIIYSFHMPLFFIISGMFISNKYSVDQYFYKKAKELLVPYYVTCCLISVTSILIELIKGSNITDIITTVRYWFFASLYASGSIQPFGIRHIGPIWFLWAMFISLCLIRLIINKKQAVLILFIFIVCSLITSNYIWLPLSAQSGFVATSFVYFGYCISKHNFSIKKFSAFSYCVIIWFLLSICCQTNMSSNVYNFFILNYLCGILGSFIFIWLFEFFCKINALKILADFLAIIGRNSLAILCLHTIEQNLFPWVTFRLYLVNFGFNSYIVVMICIVLKLLWSVGLMEVMRRFRIARSLFSMI